MSTQTQPNQGNQDSSNRSSAAPPSEKQGEKAGAGDKRTEAAPGARTDNKPNDGSRERNADGKQSAGASEADKNRAGQSGAPSGQVQGGDKDKNAQDRSKRS